MPTLKIQSPDGQVVTLNTPDDATEEQIQSAVDSVVQQMGGSPTTEQAQPNKFAKADGTPFQPADFMDPMTFMERMGKRFTENTEALANVPSAAKNLITGEGGRGKAALETVGGLLSPFAQLTAPLEAATEHAAVGLGASENAGEVAGNVAGMLTPLALMKLGQLGKLSKAGEALAAALGATPGVMKPTPGIQDFIAQAGKEVSGERNAVTEMVEQMVRKAQGAEFDPTLPTPGARSDEADLFARMMEPQAPAAPVASGPEIQTLVDTAGPFDRIKTASPEEMVARLMSEQPSQAPIEALPTVVRAAMQDPVAMARTSSLLEAAQQTVVPRPGNITANAAMETSLGQIERMLPKPTDFFRTTQEMIEKATGKQGTELLRERDAVAAQIQEALVARKNASEMVAAEATLDAVAPKVVQPAPSALVENSPVKGMNVEDFDRFLLTGNKPALVRVAKSPVATDVAAGMLGVEGKAIQPGPARMLFEGLFKESTRQVAGFGPAGKLLSREMVGALDKGEREAGAAVTAVQKLLKGFSGPEKDSLVDFLDNGAQALTPRVGDVGVKIRALLDDVAKRATQAQMSIKNPMTGEVIPWTPRPDGNYFPHYSNIDLEELFQNPRRMADAVKELAADNAIDIGEARRMLDFMMQNTQRRYGNLEMSRVMNWRKWNRDPEQVLGKYFSGAYKRLNLAETFNADYSRADQLVEMIGQQSNDSARGMARTYADRILGREHNIEGWKAQLSHDARNFETATKLGQAVIANSSQPVLLATVAGLNNTFKALGDVMFRNGSEFAGMTGATLDATMAQIQRELGAGSAGQSVLRRTGFSAVERFNRVLSANAGKHFAHDQFSRLMGALDSGATSRANYYREELTKMGISPAEAIGRGSLSLDDLYKAGQSMTKRTQFKTGTPDLPISATTDLGKVLFQFKSFSFKSAQLFKDEIVKEAARGNFAPLVRASLLMPLAGEAVNDIQALVNGKTRPDSVVERIADNFAAVGAFGLLYTGFKSIGFGPGAVAGLVMGPAITDMIRLATNVGTAGKSTVEQLRNPNSKSEPLKPLAKQFVSAIPTVGPTIANRIWPSQEEQRRQKGNQ